MRHSPSGGAGASAAWVTMVLSHGAGGGIDAPDLVAVAAGLPAYGVDVVLVEQPWRVAGRRLAPRPDRLDAAFEAVLAHVAPATPFVVGGRSAGARVACRTGAGLGAVGVLALA
ncbi:MAG: hydrolase, partial [Actinomycetota bacterium]|nr:hydrolase [Actinomycetota bacterium]